MRTLFDRSGEISKLVEMLTELASDTQVGTILLLAGDDNAWTPGDVDEHLRNTTKPLLGGIFPRILHEQECLTRGTITIGLPCLAHITVIESLSGNDRDFESDLDKAFSTQTIEHAKTMFVFVDGFAAHISALIDSLYNQFGLDINYLGGGAGSLSLKAKPCVISNQGLTQDSAVLALTDLLSGIGVAHGWLPISDAFKVTEVEGNVIHSLDWRPAYQVYRETVEAHSGLRFQDDNFFSIAKAYPFGIAKLGAEMVVRDPLMRKGDALVCVGEVARGSYVHILNGNEASLLVAASQARGLAESAMGSTPAHGRLFVDCISRVLFLEDRFHHELDAVSDGQLPMVGALTIGEIANSGQDYLEFYNKTAVVGIV